MNHLVPSNECGIYPHRQREVEFDHFEYEEKMKKRLQCSTEGCPNKTRDMYCKECDKEIQERFKNK